MAGKIIIDTEGCKGCGLCVVVCPKDCIDISEQSNKHGYFPAQANNTDCTGCAMCAIICPDAVIEVQRDSNITSIDSGNKDRLSLTKEKT
jgi:2-oxoglutarate ferredoxin oxidoreductase subunit delta